MIKYEVIEIEEPDFGCEGRPDEAVPMAKVTLRSVKDGVMTMAEIADGYLYQEEIDEDQYFNITFCQKRCHRLMSVDCGCIEHHSSRQSALVKFINLKRIGVSKMLEHLSRLLIVCYCYFHLLPPDETVLDF